MTHVKILREEVDMMPFYKYLGIQINSSVGRTNKTDCRLQGGRRLFFTTVFEHRKGNNELETEQHHSPQEELLIFLFLTKPFNLTFLTYIQTVNKIRSWSNLRKNWQQLHFNSA